MNFMIAGTRWQLPGGHGEGCGGAQAVGLGERRGSSKFVLFTAHEGVRWSGRIAPFILILGTTWERVV